MTPLNGFSAAFRDLPIRQKVRIVFLLVTVTALLLAGFGIVAADSVMFYRYLQRDLTTLVSIIGDNSTGALAFDDAKAANETLAALRAKSHIETACLYQRDGNLLANYMKPNYRGVCPPPQGEQIRYENRRLVASHQITLAGRQIGTLVLQYDLVEILERIEVYSATVLTALLLSCALTIALSARLRALIAEPILELAAVARRISQGKDFAIRAEKHSQDEIGTLADALNQMMQVIQSRDIELRAALEQQTDARDRLEQLNADLKRTNTELARSHSDLERFAFMASHDLQEPLRMITSYSQLLVQEHFAGVNGRPAEFVEHIVGGTRRMRELLADLLAYSQIASSTERPMEPVDLNQALKTVHQALSIRISETSAEIIAETLPVVHGHSTLMASLLQNLIENAIKYRREDPPQIRISVEEGDEHFTFAVADNGIGIAADYYDRIFVAFQRLQRQNIPGNGIGLAICKRVIERYGGRIWVESEVGIGSTFRFTLPKPADQRMTA